MASPNPGLYTLPAPPKEAAMAHRHVIGEQITQFFVAQRNSDQTEGRGANIDVGTFENPTDAYSRIKGEAVQGCGDGDVVRRTYYRCSECPELVKVDERIYVGDNYSKNNMLGKGTYKDYMKDGWRNDFSPVRQDPEFDEYIRLKKKFEGA